MDESQSQSMEQMTETAAHALVQAAASHAFRLFNDADFRRLAGFDRLGQTEQDRIFNELVCAFLVLIMLILEAPDLRVDAEFRGYLAELKKRIPGAHVEQLRKLGIEKRHLKEWEKLIGMRYEEFARDKHGVRAAAMRLESRERDLDLDDLAGIQLLVPVQAVAIGCHDHVCRGKTEGHDDLFKSVLKPLSRFYVEIRVRLEGGKITWWTRLWMALRRMVRRLRK